jgi:pantetheine-phosphate adenylyltransferase
MKKKIAVYAGTFDPLTLGHLDIIERSRLIFDEMVVALLRNRGKEPLFSAEERCAMIAESCAEMPNVRVEAFDGLLVDFARKAGAGVIIRGIRAVSDYEYELQMALMNRKLDESIETIFMLPGEMYNFLSSRLVKEVASLGGSVEGLMPPHIETLLLERIPSWKGGGSRQDDLL